MLERLYEVQNAVFARIRTIIAAEVLAHLLLCVILTVGSAILFATVFMPNIRNIQTERILVLKLMLLVPKSVVWDFVYTIYRDSEEEDEDAVDEDDDGISRTGQAAKDAMKAKALKLKSEDQVEILNENKHGLLYFFGLGLASICLPLIVHVAWRYSFNAAWSTKLYYYYDIITLYTYASSFL